MMSSAITHADMDRFINITERFSKDKTVDGKISYDEIEALFKKKPDTLKLSKKDAETLEKLRSTWDTKGNKDYSIVSANPSYTELAKQDGDGWTLSKRDIAIYRFAS
jgi:hypothetical protein